MMQEFDCIVIGGGQSALACAYYLRRTDINYVLLDANETAGGSWTKTWDSLTLFSPAEHSSLPGWMMPKSAGLFPSKQEVMDYLTAYEQKYNLPVQRGVEVNQVKKTNSGFEVQTNTGRYRCKALIAATGTYREQFIPEIKGKDLFEGVQIHSAQYVNEQPFKGKKVLIVGEGNSGAQILAEVSKVAECYWATQKDPEFLPDDVDGRVLFDSASAIYYAKKQGKELDLKKINLGNIVMVPTVKEARERGVLKSHGRLESLNRNEALWENVEPTQVDAIIWCTGFGYNTRFLNDIVTIDHRGKIATNGTRSTEEPSLWLVGYGGWTGFASATLIGVGRSARQTVTEVVEALS